MSNQREWHEHLADQKDGWRIRPKSTGEVVTKSTSAARALIEKGEAELVATAPRS
jgi:hypothetical protein